MGGLDDDNSDTEQPSENGETVPENGETVSESDETATEASKAVPEDSEASDGPTKAAVDSSPAAETADPEQAGGIRRQLMTTGIAAGLGFGALVIPLVVVLPVVLVGSQLGLSLPESPLFLISLNFLLGQMLGMGGISALYLWKTGRGIEYVNIRWPTVRESAIIAVAPFVIIVVSVVVSQLSLVLGVEPSDHAISGLGDVDPTLFLYLIPFMIFIVGPFEELLYRGIVQNRLRESFGPAAAILLASLVFALIHVPAYGLGGSGAASMAASLSALFAGSLVFGGIYEWTENLTVVALVHGLYNSILLALLYVVTVYGPELEEFAEQAEQAVVFVGL